jgi:hypothetical protein
MKRDRFNKIGRDAGVLGFALCLWAVAISAVGSAAHGQEAGSLNPMAQQSLSHLSETRERPLFAQSRHKPMPPPSPVRIAAPPHPPPMPPKVDLLGIVKTNQDMRAVLRMGSAEKVLHLRLGDVIGGWKVTEIAARHITLSLDDRTTSIALFENPETRPLAGNGRNGRVEARWGADIRGD